MKRKPVLAENPHILQFVEQEFPVTEETSGTGQHKYISKSVMVISFLSSDAAHHKTYKCSHFYLEVVKDYNGFISYILMGKGYDQKSYDPEIWIMRTDDFNRAYNLKNKLDELVGNNVSDLAKFPCFGSLQREKRWWEHDKVEA